jgi:hypothetical protein
MSSLENKLRKNELSPRRRSLRRLIGQLFEAALEALLADFWRTCESFVIRLFLFVLLLVALAELVANHVGTLKQVARISLIG